MADKFKILIHNNVSRSGLDLFNEERYDVGMPQNPDAILLRSHNLHNLKVNKNLVAVGRAGAGVNNIPVGYLSQAGIPVFNTPGANANAVKELVLAAILISARNVLPAANYVESLNMIEPELKNEVEAAKKNYSGFELPGRKLGVIGLGKIGSLVASACLKLGMRVVGYDPTITVDSAWNLSTNVKRATSLNEVVSGADFLTVHVPLIEDTKNLLSKSVISNLKDGATILNFSRDGIVENDAIAEMIASEKLSGYICDFPKPDLRGVPGVVCLPHLGASTLEAEENCAVMVVQQVKDYLENGNISNSVNFPVVQMERESEYRLGIANENVPNMVGQISTLLAENNLNIHNMVNKSRENMAYTLVDVDSAVGKNTIDSISAVKGILGVRYLPVIRD